MIRNILAATFRNLARNWLYSAISILGLVVGLCTAIVGSAVLRNHLTHDQFIPGYNRTYLVMSHLAPADRAPNYMSTDIALAGQLEQDIPQIEAAARIEFAQVTLRRGEVEAGEFIHWADPDTFNLLPLPRLAGDLRTALQRPDGIVLPRSKARKYFGRDDPLGETLEVVTIDRPGTPGGIFPMTVTAIIEDLPVNNTSLPAEIFLSNLAPYSGTAIRERTPDLRRNAGEPVFTLTTYVRLAPNASIESVTGAMPEFLRRHTSAQFLAERNYSLEFIRLDNVHLHPFRDWAGISRSLRIGTVVVFLILFIACSNFINLSTARAAPRALEVGIRKVSGAARRSLILQFLGEAFLSVAIAACLALGLAEILLPHMNAATESGAVLDLDDPALLAAIVLGAAVVGVLAGLHPAFVLSAFRPSGVLKGRITHSHGANALRQVLVTAQFAILIALAIAAITVYRQHDYATGEAMRMDTDQVVVLRSMGATSALRPPGVTGICTDALMTELRALPGVRGAACGSMLAFVFLQQRVALKDGSTLNVRETRVTPGYLELYGQRPVAGRFYAPDASPDDRTILINETAARRLGYASATVAVGQLFPGTDAKEIIGVVPDFGGGAGDPIEPWIFTNDPARSGAVSVKLTGRDIPETLAALDRVWRAHGTGQANNRVFFDDDTQELNLAMLRQAQGFAVFSGIAVLLACLGLAGLAVSAAQRRTKEIGIRKSMGAHTGDVMRLLNWELAKPVLWANLIAWPLTYWLMQRWLEGFAYHVDLELWTFALCGGLAFFIALLTVSLHSWIVARAKPVHALRYE